MIEDFFDNIYFKFGNYFTGKKRTQPFYICLFLGLIIIHYLCFHFKIIANTETLYWVFSSLVQALITLVAVLGAVSMFQIERKKGYVSDPSFKGYVHNYFHTFTIFTFSVVLISLLFLMFTPILSKFYLGWDALYIIFILTCRVLFLVAKTVWAFLID